MGWQGMFIGLSVVPLLFALLLSPLFAGLAYSSRSKRRLKPLKTGENPSGLF
jgi:hypothetical protein